MIDSLYIVNDFPLQIFTTIPCLEHTEFFIENAGKIINRSIGFMLIFDQKYLLHCILQLLINQDIIQLAPLFKYVFGVNYGIIIQVRIHQYSILAKLTMNEMESDYDEGVNLDNQDQIDESVAFNSQLDGYLGYERKPFHPDLKSELHLMNIDVSARVEKKYFKQAVEDDDGNQFEKDVVVKMPLIQIYSTTEAGHSVCVNVRDFDAYFFAPFPSGKLEETENNLNLIRDKINSRMKDCNTAVKRITIIEALNLRFYQPDEVMKEQKYMKIQIISQAYVPEIRKMFQQGQHIAGDFYLPRQTFESNIPYLLRFMIDKQIVGMGWYVVQPGYEVVPENKKMTRCQLQINASVKLIRALPCQGPWSKLAPQRILSFDIECAAQHGFPSAERDPVIQIACVCKRTDKEVEDYKVVFVLNGSAPISGVHIKNMRNEVEMLEDFQKLVITYDPDFIIGYNMINFDIKYLLERAKALKIKNYGYFSRNLYFRSEIKKGRFQSKVMGMRETFEINTDGRIQLDLLIHMHRQHKLTSYRLNNVSYQFLGDQKQDVHHSQITKLHNQSMDGRKRLAIYCLKDAELPLRLMEKLCCLYNYSEMARVTGVPINFLLNRGQQIKVVSQLLRKARKRNFIMPTERVKGNAGEISFEGAYVIDPKPGFYQQPIATLDFASLYPSIMMAHNLCYTTLVKKIDLDYFNLNPDQVTKTPQDCYFVKKDVREGLLPQILRELITARKKAKKQLAETTDPMLQKVLDGRQLALKISANSVYGFTGATVGQLPCLEISSSVTSFGRQMIERTKKSVMQNFDCDVIYGDTDSVMVKFNLKTKSDEKSELIKEAMELGREAAALISKQFISPIKLEFEKVYFPYLLIAKKRYAGVYYTRPDKYDKIDKKGIEAVRRDNCLLIREILETVLETVLAEGNKQKAIKYIQDTIANLLQNKVDISKLVITKAISKGTQEQDDKKADDKNKKTYKSKQAHTELAEKMRKRDENIEINIGDRIPYVMINGAKWSKNYENAEDPKKVLEEDLPIDYDYYINKQIRPPLQRLLKNTGIVENTDILFAGEHTRLRYAPKINEKSALGSFLKKTETCEGCKRQSNSVVCSNCEDKKIDIYLRKKDECDELKKEQSKMTMECNNCQRFISNEVICENFDCPIFYRRIKVKKELKEKEKHLERFTTGYTW